MASSRYHSEKPLTYSYGGDLPVGAIVSVMLQNRPAMAVVTNKVAKPPFTTKSIIDVISDNPLPKQIIELIYWMSDYYPAPIGFLANLVLPSSLLQKSRSTKVASKPKHTPISLPPLTTEQQNAIKAISEHIPKSILLHGETGSGKTRVYTELALEQNKQGKSVIILTPEIGLTPQLARSFEESLPNVVVMHSNLTPAQRRNRWQYILNAAEPLIVIGPRSALFVPLKNIGLIIIDEAHDQAYKQEQQPHYLTSRVAAALAKFHEAGLVFGTATPLIADYYAFEQKNLPIIRMKELAIASSHEASIKMIKLSDRADFSRSAYLSNTLIDAISTTIKQGEQSLIFLNRRGTARLVLCEACGWHATCPRCDIALTYHGDHHELRCHTCGYAESAPTSCPDCKHPDIAYRSIGTKTIEKEIGRLFPVAKVRRFDSDLLKADRLEESYADIRDGGIDVLVGTQMLAKGLDLPKLSFVGVVVADTSLLIPDFTAEEHTYQMLSQIMGRVGRGHRGGHIVIQTYNPDNPTLRAALSKDFQAFYSRQIEERKQFGFPPFVYLLKLRVSRAKLTSAESAASQVVTDLRMKFPGVQVIGPSPAFHEKSQGKYNWQIIVKSKSRSLLLDIIKYLPKTVQYDIDPLSLI